MDQSSLDNELETKEKDFKVADAGNTEFKDLERKRMESIGEETEGEEAQSMSDRSGYLHIPYGFQSRGSYKHASKNCEIVGGIIWFLSCHTAFTLDQNLFMGYIDTMRNEIITIRQTIYIAALCELV